MSEPARIWFTAAFRLSAFSRVSYKCNASHTLQLDLREEPRVLLTFAVCHKDAPGVPCGAGSPEFPRSPKFAPRGVGYGAAKLT